MNSSVIRLAVTVRWWVALLVALALWGLVAPPARAAAPLARVTSESWVEAAPSVVRDGSGKLHTVFHSDRLGNYDIWYAASSDQGSTWSTPIALTTHSSADWYPSITVGNDGKLWLFWSSDRAGVEKYDIWYMTSSTGGSSWSSPTQLTTHDLWDYAPSAMQARDGRLWVAWYSYRSGNWDIWYKTTTDGGLNWSEEQQLTTHASWDHNPDIIELANDSVWVVWHSQRSGNLDVWVAATADDGQTWAPAAQLTYNGTDDSHPSIVQSSGTIYLFWHSARNGQDDLYYKLSTNNGATWSNEYRYTYFTGPDQDADAVVLASGGVGLVFQSDRAANQDLWFAALGVRDDINPPPHFEASAHTPEMVTEADLINITARVTDNEGLSSVALVWWLNGQAQADTLMADDGAHGDGAANDGQYGVTIGPYPASSVVAYRFRVTDTDANAITAPVNNTTISVQGPFAKTSSILLVLDQGPDDNTWLEPYFTEAITTAGYTYNLWRCDQRGDVPQNILNQYASDAQGVVVWAIPETGYLASSETQNRLQLYLDSGGDLFLVGQDVGFNLRYSNLLPDYLHMRLVQDDIGLYRVNGVNGDLLDGLSFCLTQSCDPANWDGVENQRWPSELDPIAPAIIIGRYDAGAGAAAPLPASVKKSAAAKASQRDRDAGAHLTGGALSEGGGALRVDMDTYRVVVFGFGMEAFQSDAVRAQAMQQVIGWLQGTVSGPTPTPSITPTYTPSPAASATPTPTPTTGASPTPTRTATATPTATPKYTETPTQTPVASYTPTHTATVGPSVTSTPTITLTPTPGHERLVLQHGYLGYTGAEDTYLDSWAPTAQYAGANSLQVWYDDVIASLVKFDLSGVPSPIELLDARLRLYATQRDSTTLLVTQAHPVLRGWDVAHSTWVSATQDVAWDTAGCNNASDREAVSAHNTMIVGAGQWYEWNLTDEVRGWLQDPASNRGMLLLSLSKTYAQVEFASSEHPDQAYRPQLALQFDRILVSEQLTQTLAPGWHLLSYPYQLPSDTVTNVLASVAGSYDLVQLYDASDAQDPWKLYDASAPEASDLQQLPLGQGFWVHMTQAADWTVGGNPATAPQIALQQGFNMIGWPSTSVGGLPWALNSIAGQYSVIWGYDPQQPAPWLRYAPADNAWTNNLLQITPGRGYWIHATEACTIHVP